MVTQTNPPIPQHQISNLLRNQNRTYIMAIQHRQLSRDKMAKMTITDPHPRDGSSQTVQRGNPQPRDLYRLPGRRSLWKDRHRSLKTVEENLQGPTSCRLRCNLKRKRGRRGQGFKAHPSQKANTVARRTTNPHHQTLLPPNPLAPPKILILRVTRRRHR